MRLRTYTFDNIYGSKLYSSIIDIKSTLLIYEHDILIKY